MSVTRLENNVNPRKESAPSENLALLYQGLLTGIVRMQSRRQHISEAAPFRRRTKAALQEVEINAVAAGYDATDVRETHFAIVAFLDAVVLNSNDPIRAEWERQTLQEELFGQSDAGVVFFEKLDHFRSRRDSQQLSDILEVYLLCLLLGFEGRYSGGLRAELHSVAETIRRRIDDIRGRRPNLSPCEALQPPEPMAAPIKDATGRRIYAVALAAITATVVCFLASKFELARTVNLVVSRFS